MQEWLNLLLVIAMVPPCLVVAQLIDQLCDRRDIAQGSWERMNSSPLDWVD